MVHAASNLTRTYFEFVSGRDTKKVRREGGWITIGSDRMEKNG